MNPWNINDHPPTTDYLATQVTSAYRSLEKSQAQLKLIYGVRQILAGTSTLAVGAFVITGLFNLIGLITPANLFYLPWSAGLYLLLALAAALAATRSEKTHQTNADRAYAVIEGLQPLNEAAGFSPGFDWTRFFTYSRSARTYRDDLLRQGRSPVIAEFNSLGIDSPQDRSADA